MDLENTSQDNNKHLVKDCCQTIDVFTGNFDDSIKSLKYFGFPHII